MKKSHLSSFSVKKKRSSHLFKNGTVCIFLCLALFLSACGGSKSSPEEVLKAICQSQSDLPAGRLYVLSAPSDDARHPDDGWLFAMFGKEELPATLSLVEDAAFFSSYTHACEFAVFLCKSAKGTSAVSQLCLQRLNTLKLYWEAAENNDTPLQNAGVTVRGKWVILYLCKDPDAALRAFRRTL